MAEPLARPAWLILRNDLRLLWRDLRTGKMRLLANLGFLGVMLAALQTFALFLTFAIKTPPPLFGETIAWFFFAFMMLGTAMNQAIAVLFERADFDLLLSSPVPSRAILLARWWGMTLGSAAGVALFLIPLLNAAAIGLARHYLWGYVVWLLLASLAACAGIFLTVVLVRWLGARRARTWTQVLGAVLGATIYLGFQLQNILRQELGVAVAGAARKGFEHPALTFVARAGRGDPLSLLLLFALTGGVLLGTLRFLARLFVDGIQEAGGAQLAKKRAQRPHVFADGLSRATFRKDLRLITRNPLLLSKILPSALYLLPLVFALGRSGPAATVGMLASFGVLCSLILSTQLAGVATAGEEGWDMIRMSGASTVQLRMAKVAAGMAVPIGVCLLIALAIAILGRPGLALLTLAIALIGASATSWLEVATIRPTPRKDLIQQARGARALSPGRIVAATLSISAGVGSVSLAANDKWLLASAAAGVIALTALACFTLVEVRDPEFESTSA